jgi:hypothetical protein
MRLIKLVSDRKVFLTAEQLDVGMRIFVDSLIYIVTSKQTSGEDIGTYVFTVRRNDADYELQMNDVEKVERYITS